MVKLAGVISRKPLPQGAAEARGHYVFARLGGIPEAPQLGQQPRIVSIVKLYREAMTAVVSTPNARLRASWAVSDCARRYASIPYRPTPNITTAATNTSAASATRGLGTCSARRSAPSCRAALKAASVMKLTLAEFCKGCGLITIAPFRIYRKITFVWCLPVQLLVQVKPWTTWEG